MSRAWVSAAALSSAESCTGCSPFSIRTALTASRCRSRIGFLSASVSRTPPCLGGAGGEGQEHRDGEQQRTEHRADPSEILGSVSPSGFPAAVQTQSPRARRTAVMPVVFLPNAGCPAGGRSETRGGGAASGRSALGARSGAPVSAHGDRAPQGLPDQARLRAHLRAGRRRGRATAGNRFVVHKHHATADHYDLRLELGGVLKSWAVPKGPSLDPAEKRLAVETEDHPVEYIDFEGVIPEGEYGGGPMIVWDTGTWAPMGDAEEHLAKGDLKFRLAGEKLHGGWMLVRLKPKPGEKQNNWLLFKERDQAADPGARHPRRPAREREVRPPHRGAASPRRRRSRPPDCAPDRSRAPTKAPLPARSSRSSQPRPSGRRPATSGCTRSSSTATAPSPAATATTSRLITRAGLDWTHRYGDLADAFRALPCRQRDDRRRDRRPRRPGHHPLRPLAGGALGRRRQPARSSSPSTCCTSTAGT